MPLTLDQLVTPLTADSVMATWIANLETVGIPASTWRKGGALRTIMAVVATSYAGFTQVQVAANKAQFLDLASTGWLTLLARYLFNVERPVATFATGAVTLVNGGGGLYTHAAGTYQVKNSTTGKVYTNVSGFTLNPLATLTIDIVAVEAGSASSSAPTTIDAQVTDDNAVTVSNADAVVGTDALDDEGLRALCRAKRESLSPNGPRGAYKFAVLTALRNDGSLVDINRVQVSSSSSLGQVHAYAASPSGTPISTDLDAARTNVENIARPDAVTFTLDGAVGVPISQSLTIWATTTPGLDATGLGALVDAALIAMAEAYPIGGIKKTGATQGYLFAGNVEGTAKGVHPAIFDVEGAVDTPLNDGQVPILTNAITVRFVEAPE